MPQGGATKSDVTHHQQAEVTNVPKAVGYDAKQAAAAIGGEGGVGGVGVGGVVGGGVVGGGVGGGGVGGVGGLGGGVGGVQATRSIPLPVLQRSAVLQPGDGYGGHEQNDGGKTADISWLTSQIVPVGSVNSKLATYPAGVYTHAAAAQLPKPNPSVSNRGLVIVQVHNGGHHHQQQQQQQQAEEEEEEPRLTALQDAILKGGTMVGSPRPRPGHETFAYDTQSKDVAQTSSNVPKIVVSPPVQHQNAPYNGSSGGAKRPGQIPAGVGLENLPPAAHQLIHGFPPNTFLPEGEEEEEEEEDDDDEEEEEEDEEVDEEIDECDEDPDYCPGEEQDEGYRTNSSTSSGSPSVSSVDSPPPSSQDSQSTKIKRKVRTSNNY